MSEPNVCQLRITGLAGVAAALVMFSSDCLIMDSSTSGAELLRGWLDRFTATPNWRLEVAGLMAPIGATLFMGGFAHIYLALKPGGRKLAISCAAALAIGYNILAAWHCAAPMFAFINRMQPGAENPFAHEGMDYLRLLMNAGLVPAASALLLLPLLIIFRPSLYPKWFAALTPGLLYVVAIFAFPYVPAPIGGYLTIGSGSLCLLLFFMLSTSMLWNVGTKPATNVCA